MLNMKKYLLLLLIGSSFLTACAQDQFQRTSKGTMYKNFTNNTGDRIKVGDIVTINAIQKTDKDSILYSSYKGAPIKVQVQAEGDMMDVLPLLTLKDSAMIKVPTDSLFKDPHAQRPAFFPKGSSLIILLHVEKIQSLQEAMAEREADAAKKQADEVTLGDKYVADHKLTVITTASGLKYKVVQAGIKPKPIAGDSVYVNYVGHTLEGKIFDTSYEQVAKSAGLQQIGREYEPLKFVLGQQGIIPGWQEGILLLNEGSKATLIIPSKLAYGDKAAGPDIPPYSTLVDRKSVV